MDFFARRPTSLCNHQTIEMTGILEFYKGLILHRKKEKNYVTSCMGHYLYWRDHSRYYCWTEVKNIQEWALGGRNLTWIDVGCILAAFQMGGTTIIGVAQNGFKIGYAGAWYSITGTIAMLCMLLVVKPLRQEN